ncbi:MAG: rod shape-determining protein RodA [Chthoniobacterales bacterium]|nr:rod shape-determining protein RodA [Chthoniobacterales bacterium]
MSPLFRKLLRTHWPLVLLMVGLATFGVIAIYSVTHLRTGEGADFWRRQTQWIGIGLFLFFITSLIDYRWIKWGALPTYALTMVFLVLVLVMGREVYGAERWLHLGPVNFQPSQPAMIAGIMILALFLSRCRDIHPALQLGGAAAIIGAPALLILKQPNLGSTMVLGVVLLAMLFAGGLPLRYLISILLLLTTAIPLTVNLLLKGYQRSRIVAFLDPSVDPQGSGWGINQSLIAIGSGGWGGKGFLAPDSQVELGFLPATAVHNDYIFSAIAEQWGFVGGAALLCAFALLLLICIFIAIKARDQFGLLLAVGLTALLFFHVYQNIGMTIAIMPITGLPLPLVSYGGTFVVIIMFALGLLNSIWIHRKEQPDPR